MFQTRRLPKAFRKNYVPRWLNSPIEGLFNDLAAQTITRFVLPSLENRLPCVHLQSVTLQDPRTITLSVEARPAKVHIDLLMCGESPTIGNTQTPSDL